MAARGNILSLEDDKDRRPKSVPPATAENQESEKPRRKRGPTPEVGQALRAAYQRTINEDIPPEMLDLLGKLG
jgi:hypothetical protein